MVAPYIFTLLLALWQAWSDATDIALNNPINHTRAWLNRAGVTLFVCVGFTWASAEPWWKAVVLAVGCAALFSCVFRTTLNLMRKKDWRYLGYGAAYDSWWMKVTNVNYYGYITPYTEEKRFNQFYEKVVIFRDKVHRAGTIATIFEALVLCASALALIATR